jgi:hypothetical protein
MTAVLGDELWPHRYGGCNGHDGDAICAVIFTRSTGAEDVGGGIDVRIEGEIDDTSRCWRQ